MNDTVSLASKSPSFCHLDRTHIRKLLVIGLIGAILTGAGDFLVSYGDETGGTGLAASLLSSAPNLSDAQLIWGGLLGFVGIFLEGIGYFALYRLMVDAAPKLARIYRVGILAYIWVAPVGCHMNIGLLNYAYKNLLLLDPSVASQAADTMIYAFYVPLWVVLICFMVPMLVVQFLAFSKGRTPYPKSAKWFHLVVGAIPPLVIAAIIGVDTALGAGIGTMFLSFGNLLVFGDLLATLPKQDRFDEFEAQAGEAE